jgi:Animal haem peroxidase
MNQHAARIARDHCLAPSRVDAPLSGGRYRALFSDLPPLRADEAALHALGRPGGPCDLGADADRLDAQVAAVWPFFGQFLAHDITADRSPIADRADPGRLRNARAPRADLEGMYGVGPIGAPFLYDKDDPAKLLLSPGGRDLPRNHEGIALAGDPRNDVQLFTSQLLVAFIGLHNRLVDRLRDDGVAEEALFAEARRATTWHYQHVILREFLPGLIGAEAAAALLEGGARLYRVDEHDPYLPFEFADAAYRYGHAQIRDRYMVNARFGPVPVFPDLMGFGPVPPEHAVDWTLMIDVDGHPPAQRSKRIDTRLPGPLIALPTQVSGSEPGTDYASLATRDLQRGQAVGLPSGEAVARRLGVPALTADQVGLAEHGWHDETPLWFYILKEADVLRDGEHLGPVGGRIVGEVLVGIIDADPASFRAVDPAWTPTLPVRRPGAFGLADVLVPDPPRRR